jgi:hypothetical protein
VAGFGTRVFSAVGHVLSGDEALHFGIANAASIADVYRASLPNAHPPLFFLLLHFWIRLGTSEFLLRLFPVLCGTLFLWVAWRWARRLLDPPAGLSTLAILAFSPGLITASAELRHYSLLFVLAACGLLALERGFASGSPRTMLASAGFLSLAMLSHYSGAWVVLAAFVYGVVRLRERGLRSRAGAAWLTGQIGILTVSLLLFVSHVSGLRGEGLEKEVASGYLRGSYFDSATSGATVFVVQGTVALFSFLAGSRGAGVAGLVLCVLGLVRLAFARRAAALLLAVPFAATLAAALLRLYPYGGTRHSAYLGIFAAAAAGAALSRLVSHPLRAGALAAGLAVAWYASTIPRPTVGRLQPLRAAVAELRRQAPADSVFFVDRRTAYLLSYQLAPRQESTPWRRTATFDEFDIGRYHVVASSEWRFDASSFERELAALLRSRPAGVPTLWFFQAGWGLDPATEIDRRFPNAAVTLSRRFGENSIARAAF